jgi:hypothetical protein
MEPWSVCRPVVRITLMRSRIRIRVKVLRWIRMRIRIPAFFVMFSLLNTKAAGIYLSPVSACTIAVMECCVLSSRVGLTKSLDIPVFYSSQLLLFYKNICLLRNDE